MKKSKLLTLGLLTECWSARPVIKHRLQTLGVKNGLTGIFTQDGSAAKNVNGYKMLAHGITLATLVKYQTGWLKDNAVILR